MAVRRTFLAFATAAECTLWEMAMRNSRNALLGILALTSASGATTALPTEGAELYARSAYKAVPGPLFSYPYGATYAPDYAYSHAPPYWNYYDPFYPSYYGYRSNCYRSRSC